MGLFAKKYAVVGMDRINEDIIIVSTHGNLTKAHDACLDFVLDDYSDAELEEFEDDIPALSDVKHLMRKNGSFTLEGVNFKAVITTISN